MLAEKWEDAVLTAENKIKGREASYLRLIQKFGSPEALMDDLQKKKEEAQKKNLKSMYSRATL